MKDSRWLPTYVAPTLAFLLYLAFPSQQYDYDVLTELINIERGTLRIGDPAHPLYSWVGWVWYSIWKLLGYSSDSMWPMQVLNAICASAALLIFQLTLLRLGVNRVAALLATLGAGLSYSYWIHTVDAFFIIPASLSALTALYCAVRASQADSASMVIAAGVAIAVSTLFYQVSLLLVPALWVALYDHRRAAQRWIMACTVLTLTAVTVASTAWIAQAVSTHSVSSVTDFLRWFSGTHGGMDTGLWRRDGVPWVSTTLKAWVGTIVPLYEGLRLRDLLQGQISLVHLPGQLGLVLLSLVVLGVVVTGVVRSRQSLSLSDGAGKIAALIGLWFVCSGCTVVWFDRAEVKLWLIPMFAFWTACAAALGYWLDTLQRAQVKTLLVTAMTAFVVTTALGNFFLAILPDSRAMPREMTAAKALVAQMKPEDVAISATADWVLYVEYLCADCRLLYVLDSVQRLGKDQPSSIERLIDEEVSRTLAKGGRVFVPDYFANEDDPAWTVWVERITGLTPAQFAQFEYPVAVERDGIVIRQLRRPAGSN